MSRHEQLTSVKARIRAADDKTAREVLMQLTNLGVPPEAFDRAFEEANRVLWADKASKLMKPPEAQADFIRSGQPEDPGSYQERILERLRERSGMNIEIAPAEPVLEHISLKCKMYGDQPHEPCSGTCDGHGTGLPCNRLCVHWCHEEERRNDARRHEEVP